LHARVDVEKGAAVRRFRGTFVEALKKVTVAEQAFRDIAVKA
jgi:hypothetical protein